MTETIIKFIHKTNMALHVTITSQIVLKDCFQENKTAGSGYFSLLFCEKC